MAYRNMTGKIFLSYRRDDSAGHAGRIYDRLEREFGRDVSFIDVDDIPLGRNFVEVLNDAVGGCELLIAIIGPDWLDARDEDGNRRLDEPTDLVRVEIASALRRDIPVIPLLLNGARAPAARHLPEDLQGLALRQALDVRYSSFHTDLDRLITSLKGSRPEPAPSSPDIPAGAIAVEIGSPARGEMRQLVPGEGKTEWFEDSPEGPEMVVVPAGSFIMGSPENEPARESWQKGTESPQREVTIAQPFAVGRHAITRGQFEAFVNDTDHDTDGDARLWKDGKWVMEPNSSWRNPGFTQGDDHPVVCVSWHDAKAYAAWLADRTGRPYRLLAEAEWEYAARAGSTTGFWWGSSITPEQANYDGNSVYEGGGRQGESREATVPVGSFLANPWGLYNVHGNVWEWCEDAWHDNYNGAPPDGSAWVRGGDPSRPVVRGGCWGDAPGFLRAANRDWHTAGYRNDALGFRLARTLNP